MKKIVILVVVFAMFLSGCGVNKEINETPQYKKDPSKSSVKEPNKSSVKEPNRQDEERHMSEEEIEVIDEESYRLDYTYKLATDKEFLAKFLLATEELEQFAPVDTEDEAGTLAGAIEIFATNEEVHEQASKRAQEVFRGFKIVCDWAAIREMEPAKALPLATTCTGEPISSEPAGKWDGNAR